MRIERINPALTRSIFPPTTPLEQHQGAERVHYTAVNRSLSSSPGVTSSLAEGRGRRELIKRLETSRPSSRRVRGEVILVRPFLHRASQIKSRPGALPPPPKRNFKAAKSLANEIPPPTTRVRHDGGVGASLSLSGTVLSTGVSIILCTA